MEELAGLWRGEHCPAQRPCSSLEPAPATGDGARSRASGILLPRRQVRCWCCLETGPWVAAESKTMSDVAGVNADVLPRCVTCFYQPLPGNCLAETELLCLADPGPGEGEVSPSNGLFARTSGSCHRPASSGLHCREVGALEIPKAGRPTFGFKNRRLPPLPSKSRWASRVQG